MKHIVLKLVSLFAFTSTLYAAPGENRLVLKVDPLPNNYQQIRSVLSVKNNGLVNLRTCNLKVSVRPCFDRTVTRLDARRMDTIERLIRAAEFGKIAQTSGAICAAVPVKHVVYRADQGKVLLQEGNAPCAHIRFNQTPAAKQLVRILDDLSRLANGH